MPKGKKPSTPKMPMKGKMPPGMPPKGMGRKPMPMMTPAQMQQMMGMMGQKMPMQGKMPPAGMPPKGMPPKGMPAWAGKAMKPPAKASKPAPKRKK